MQLTSIKNIGVSVAALALLFSASGCTVSKSLAESSDAGNTFAPKTVAPEQAKQTVSEADTVREAIKANGNIASAAVGNTTSYPSQVSDDGRVYNVFSTVNIRSCPSTKCKILRVAYPGADVQNDPTGGTQTGNGYTWVRVTYGYASNKACETTAYKGWMIVNGLSPSIGKARVTKTPLNIRSAPCSGKIIKTVAPGTKLDFHGDENQFRGKWYKVVVPGTTPGALGYVDGWDYTDVY